MRTRSVCRGVIACMGALALAAIPALAQTSRGDVNNDGFVDGADALLVFQHAGGKLSLTAEQQERADVYPLPGTGGRNIGDGKVTDQDAGQLLRHVLGLVSRAELSGQFEGPAITDFEPKFGAAGTRVTLHGANFVDKHAGENVVKLSDVTATTLSATSTQLTIEVPEGAASGPFTLTTPGGTASSADEFIITGTSRGQLILPGAERARRSASDFRVLSSYGEAVPDAQGGFDLPLGDEPMQVVVAIPRSGADNGYLGIQLGDGTTGSGRQSPALTIDASSTAVALLYLNPAIFPPADYPPAELVGLIRTLPQTESLAQVIAEVFPVSSDPLSNARVQQALKVALDALLAKLKTEDLISVARRSLQAPEPEGLAGVQRVDGALMRPLDINATWVNLERKGDVIAFTMGNRWTTPVNWFTRVVELYPGQFAGGMADIHKVDADTVFVRSQSVHTGVTGARGCLNLFANLAAWMRGMVEGIGLTWPPGTTSPDTGFDARKDAVYLVRSFSGAYYISDRVEAEFMETLPNGIDDHVASRYSNTGDFFMDFLLAYCGTKVNSKVANALANVLAAAGKKLTARGLVNRKGASAVDYLNGGEIVGAVWESLPDMMDAFSQFVLEGNVVGDAAAAKGRHLLKLMRQSMPVVSQVAAWGRVVERVLGLAGANPSSFVGAGVTVTPLETAIIVVGDPFRPALTEYPKEIVPGTTILLAGRRLGAKAGENRVFLGSIEVPVVWADGNGAEIKVAVPPMPPGEMKLTVHTPAGQIEVGPITVVRMPVITHITPQIGFAAGADWGGQPFPGTRVVISGNFFGVGLEGGQPVVEDKLFFRQGEQWVEATVDATNSSPTQLVTNVPKGATTGLMVVRTPDGRQAWSRGWFDVVGSPAIGSVRPTEARAGDLIQINGTELFPSLRQTRVAFTYQGQTYIRDGWDLGAPDSVGAPMPTEIPEGATAEVVVRTPAGVSSALSVKRVAGRAAGTRLVPAVVTEVKPDGVLSIPEAIKVVQSSLDIFATAEGWDDADATVMLERTEVLDGSGYVTDVRTTGQVLSRETRGHAGNEVAHVTTKRYRQAPGQAPVYVDQSVEDVALDNPGTTAIGPLGAAQLPGIGKVEEGDVVTNLSWGKDFTDTVEISPRGANLAFDLVLDQAAAGGDIIRFTSEGTITGNVVVSTHDNTIEVYDNYLPSLEITGKLEVTGSRNTLRKLTAAGGVVLQGSNNTLVVSARGANRIACGVDIGSGAVGNQVGATTDNCDVGIRISGGAQANVVSPYVTNCKIGLLITGVTTQANRVQDASTARIGYNRAAGKDVPAPCENGVIIADGAHDNVVEANVKYCTADGVVIMGTGTSRNRFAGDVWWNGGNGISILDGPTGNTLGFTDETYASSMTSGGHGVYIRGNGTNGNVVRRLTISRNAKAGILVEGATGALPQGTLIHQCAIRPHPQGGVLLKDLKPAGNDPSATVRDCSVDGQYNDPPVGPGIVLENTAGALLDGNQMNLKANLRAIDDCTGATVGILMRGAGSNSNVSRLDAIGVCTVAGIQITGGAWGNRIENAYIADVPSVGILIEGDGKENQVLRRPELARQFEGRLLTGGVVTSTPVGVVVRGGPTSTRIEGYTLDGCTDGIIIEGPNTADTAVQSCQLKRLVVQKGALRTAVGSVARGTGCLFTGSATQSLLIKDAATKGVVLLGSVLQGAQQEAVWIDGACDVQIGSPDGPNTFQGNPGAAGIRITGGSGIRVCANTIEGPAAGILPAAGVRVEGGATGVTVGGATPGEGNVIRHHARQVHVTGAGTAAVTVANNTLGPGGRADQAVGILADGGAQGLRAERNTITRQRTSGIQVSGAGTTGITLLRNEVTAGGNGITVSDGAGKTMIGGSRLLGNSGFGVALGADTGPTTILEGSISDNKKGGIEAARPAAPKVLLVRPGVILGEVPEGVDSGTLIQVYADNGLQGRKFLGYTRVRGKAWRLEAAAPAGMGVTATVTDAAGNTSAFGERGIPAAVPPLFGEQAVAFSSTRDGNPEIYLQVPGDDPLRLTDAAAADHSPSLSLDRTKVAFVSERSGNPEIWVMGADGSAPAQRTNNAAADYDPAWSPDETKLLFTSERDGNPEVYLMNADGTGVQRLTNSPGVDRHPAWSSDGAWVALTSDRSGSADVWVMNADGSNPVRLIDHASADYDPAWSPDGAKLAFVSERDGNPEVYVMDANGANATRLTEAPGADVEPTWSPDGSWVAFTSAQAGDAELFARNVASGRRERLTVSLGVNVQPSWGGASADRTRMAVR